MAKTEERKLAKWFYVHKGKQFKEIAIEVGVSAKTITQWAQKYNWKAERAAILSDPRQRIENIKQIISNLADERISLSDKILTAEKNKDLEQASDYRKQIAQIDAAVANWNKTLTTIDKDTKVTLAQYLYVMDKIFMSMRRYDEQLFLKSIQFQEQHLNDIVIELG